MGDDGHWAVADTRTAAGRPGDDWELQKESINGKLVEVVTQISIQEKGE